MKQENRLFSQIEDTLYSYEEAYIPGAWEEFQKKKKRRRRGILFYRITSAAAVLLLFSYVTVQFFKDGPIPVKLQQVKTKVQLHQRDSVISNSGTNSNQNPGAITPNTIVKQYTIKPGKEAPVHYKSVAPVQQAIVNTPDKTNGLIANNTTENIEKGHPVAPEKAPATDAGSGNSAPTDFSVGVLPFKSGTKIAKVSGPIYDSIANQAKVRANNRAIANTTKADGVKKTTNNVMYSIVVSPSMGNQKMNFGTGVEVSYKIGNNLLVSSGVSYSSIHAGGSNTAPVYGDSNYSSVAPSAGSYNNASANKKVQNVNLDVSGFEVPLGLQYRTTNGFYVSAGVLAMGVVKDRLAYDYIIDRPVTMATLDAFGVTQQVIRVASEKQTEESQERVNRYLGFYMFSIGKKQSIGNKYLNIGPFLKVPFGGVSSENIRLLQGGIHVGFDF
jgi:hypothetical protein